MAIFLIWIVSLGSLLLMLARPRGIAEYVWICGGALLLVGTGLLPGRAALGAIGEGTDVYLFLTGMMLLAELAREAGVFDWVAGRAVRHAKGSAGRLFLWVYVAGIAVTALLSNDATAVVLTPAVLAAVRRAKVEPRPHLLACAMIANAASFLLPISNPANLVVFRSHLPALGEWLRMFLLPSVVSITATFICLRILMRRGLAGVAVEEEEDRSELGPGGYWALAGIAIAGVVLLICSGLDLQLGAPTCAAGLLTMGLVAMGDREAPRRAVRQVSWSVLPLVAGLFVIVEALNRAGLLGATKASIEWLASAADGMGKFAGGFGIALVSNGMNNLPAGLAAGAALREVAHRGVLAHAVLLGVDLGPNLSVTGSLATILWLIALRREGAEITAWEFLKVGLVAMPVALGLALLALR